jgi:hypothetical protein
MRGIQPLQPSSPLRIAVGLCRLAEAGDGMTRPPRISIAPDPREERVCGKTSTRRVLVVDSFLHGDRSPSIVYRRQNP